MQTLAQNTLSCVNINESVQINGFLFLSVFFLIRKDFISLTRTHSMVGNEHKEEEEDLV